MRVRLDTLLVHRQLAESREKAKRLILAGAVRVNGQLAGKASDLATEDAPIEVTAAEKYVSRGGHKLEAALDAFAITCTGCICLDVGASTGGFTDCLLQRGAARVHAVDVGKGQLHWRLRQDPRVIVHDDCNARNLTVAALQEVVEIASVDVSFISLKKVLPAIVALLKPGGRLVALVKPQFEAGRKEVGKGGVVRDATVHQRIVDEMRAFAIGTLGLELIGVTESPLLGPAGNKEFLIALRKP